MTQGTIAGSLCPTAGCTFDMADILHIYKRGVHVVGFKLACHGCAARFYQPL